MRYTLEQLKAMDDKELYKTWLEGHFPFERAVGCNLCLTQHAFHGGGYKSYYGRCGHENVAAAVRSVDERFTEHWWYTIGPSVLREHLEELYALRLFFDSLYARQPELQPDEEPLVQYVNQS